MAKDKKQLVYGVHGITIYDYFTMKPISQLDVIGDLTVPVTAEMESLYGGAHIWPVAGEPTVLSTEGSLELREFPEEIAEYLVAGVGAKIAADADGAVTTLTNYKGTSLVSATTGVATVGLKSGGTANLKAGVYVVEAVNATTVNVYAMSTVDFKKGTAITAQDDANLITATPLTITASTAVEVPNLGVELTGGSGTIGMTAGDTAYFEIYPPHSGVETITMGQENAEFKRVGLMLVARKRTTGELCYIHCPNALALGLPLGFTENTWNGGSVSLGIYTHETFNYSMKMTSIKGVTV